MSRDRLPPIAEQDMSSAQLAAAQAVVQGPRGALVGPFVPLLRSPELMERVQQLGAYLRYRSAVGTRLTELAILLVAREWDQQVEWAIHAPIALEAGVAPHIVDAIANWSRPQQMYADEQAVYDFSLELLVNKRVSDETWARALAQFGEQGVTDLVGINGYYTLLAMVMNAAQTPVPESSAAPLP
ncbi:MAG TPA: carboxymuconolactone decarboxylase family protein [Telluria sp.]|nr:carboxymuconolactone decarboxylase family protein [Telluria sp.]